MCEALVFIEISKPSTSPTLKLHLCKLTIAPFKKVSHIQKIQGQRKPVLIYKVSLTSSVFGCTEGICFDTIIGFIQNFLEFINMKTRLADVSFLP